ncbi:MAG TPA: hypothetical protein VK684_10795, partial [Edaphobacter sp.]|nr:hypothetical protein [Edaphobacter sp.]
MPEAFAWRLLSIPSICRQTHPTSPRNITTTQPQAISSHPGNIAPLPSTVMLPSTPVRILPAALLLTTGITTAQQAPMQNQSAYLNLLTAANTHAKAHNAPTPTLSPNDATLLGPNPAVNIPELHQ